jgi:hypothetical protein
MMKKSNEHTFAPRNKESIMATKTQRPEVTSAFQVREMPVRLARPSVHGTIDALRAAGAGVLGEGQGVIVATHSTHKSALSTASRLRRKHPDMEFVAADNDVLARPK